MAPARKSTQTISLGVTALMAVTLTGCSSAPEEVNADYAKVCRDQKTQQRLEDDKCTSSHSSHAGWYYIPINGSSRGRSIPQVGKNVSGGTDSMPPGSTSKTVSSSGGKYGKTGTVSRGGFGSKGGGAGG